MKTYALKSISHPPILLYTWSRMPWNQSPIHHRYCSIHEVVCPEINPPSTDIALYMKSYDLKSIPHPPILLYTWSRMTWNQSPIHRYCSIHEVVWPEINPLSTDIALYMKSYDLKSIPHPPILLYTWSRIWNQSPIHRYCSIHEVVCPEINPPSTYIALYMKSYALKSIPHPPILLYTWSRMTWNQSPIHRYCSIHEVVWNQSPIHLYCSWNQSIPIHRYCSIHEVHLYCMYALKSIPHPLILLYTWSRMPWNQSPIHQYCSIHEVVCPEINPPSTDIALDTWSRMTWNQSPIHRYFSIHEVVCPEINPLSTNIALYMKSYALKSIPHPPILLYTWGRMTWNQSPIHQYCSIHEVVWPEINPHPPILLYTWSRMTWNQSPIHQYCSIHEVVWPEINPLSTDIALYMKSYALKSIPHPPILLYIDYVCIPIMQNGLFEWYHLKHKYFKRCLIHHQLYIDTK